MRISKLHLSNLFHEDTLLRISHREFQSYLASPITSSRGCAGSKGGVFEGCAERGRSEGRVCLSGGWSALQLDTSSRGKELTSGVVSD